MSAKADIYNNKKTLDRTSERYISKLFPEDQEDVRHFVEDLLANSYSAGRVNKYLSCLVSIKKRLGVPFREATQEDIKRFAASLERSDYKAWTKHDLKVILRRYMRWLGKDED